jgi:uncharacterized SAM-dependent methyltransferase
MKIVVALMSAASVAAAQQPALGLSEQAVWTASDVTFGAALLLVPVVLAALVAGHSSRNRRFADATTHIALSYVTSDVTESILKSVVRWASDVAAGAIIGVACSRLAAHWLRGVW